MDVTGARMEKPLAQENPAAGQRGQVRERAGREQQSTLESVLRDQQLIPDGNVCSSSSSNSPVTGTRRFSTHWFKQGFGGLRAGSLLVFPAEIIIHYLFPIFQ